MWETGGGFPEIRVLPALAELYCLGILPESRWTSPAYYSLPALLLYGAAGSWGCWSSGGSWAWSAGGIIAFGVTGTKK